MTAMRSVISVALLLGLAGCSGLDAFVKILDASVKITDAASKAGPTGGKSVAPLPRRCGFPYLVQQRLGNEHLTGDQCRARVEPLVFAAEGTWNDKSRADYLATLPERGQTELARLEALSIKWFASRVEGGDRGAVGGRGKITMRPGNERYVARPVVRAVNTLSGLVLANVEVRTASDNLKVGEFIVYGVSSKAGVDWMGHSSENIARAVLTYFGDHFGCKSPRRARYVTPDELAAEGAKP